MTTIRIVDNEDDWMHIFIDGEIWFDNHMSSFSNDDLTDILNKLGHNATRETDYEIDNQSYLK